MLGRTGNSLPVQIGGGRRGEGAVLREPSKPLPIEGGGGR